MHNRPHRSNCSKIYVNKVRLFQILNKVIYAKEKRCKILFHEKSYTKKHTKITDYITATVIVKISSGPLIGNRVRSSSRCFM